MRRTFQTPDRCCMHPIGHPRGLCWEGVRGMMYDGKKAKFGFV